MRVWTLIKKHGMKTGLHKFWKEWYSNNKILFWIVLAIIITGILPIVPSSSTETTLLPVPYQEDNNRFPKHAIEIHPNCDAFNPWDDIPSISLNDKEFYGQYSYNTDVKPITLNYSDYTIAYYAISACGDCIPDDSLSVLDEKSCEMNNSNIFGYFEQCKPGKDQYGSKTTICQREPFSTTAAVEIIAPNGEFKLRATPIITKHKIADDQYNPVINRYAIETTITYPDWKPLPYVKWIATAILFLLDPLRSILRYFSDNWFYK
jgi:hypothetical protein